VLVPTPEAWTQNVDATNACWAVRSAGVKAIGAAQRRHGDGRESAAILLST
jgi:hypothetical protein